MTKDSALGVVYWGILPRSLDVLFIISGFVIYLPTAAREGDFGSVGSFAIRRIARLVPSYYVCLLIALLLLATVSSSPGLPDGGTIAAHLTMLQTPALLVANNFQLGSRLAGSRRTRAGSCWPPGGRASAAW